MKPDKKIKKITLEPTDGIVMSYVPEEKEYPHIIEEIKHVYIYGLPPNVEMVDDRVTTLEEKINEIIEVVNIMMRGGRR